MQSSAFISSPVRFLNFLPLPQLMKDILQKLNPTARFDGKVDNYAKYRPAYPQAVIDFLVKETGLQKDWNIADIGSGTGIFSALLLDNGYTVCGVEPNKQMRDEGEKQLSKYNRFTSLDGSAEHTGITDNSIDLITVAQAFHWMGPVAAKKEFDRILKTPGYIALVWNIRTTTTTFLQKFEQLKVDFGTDYKATRMVKELDIKAFFNPHKLVFASIPHSQLLDYEALKGQLLSTSYVPSAGKAYEDMLGALKDLFEEYNEGGLVKIDYDCKVYLRV